MKAKSNIKAFYKITLTDKNGKTKFESDKIESKSFVLQYLQFIYLAFAFNTGSLSMMNTGTTNSTVYGPGASYGQTGRMYFMLVNAPDNDSTYGIVIGQGSAAVAPSDNKLGYQITHGATGNAQIDYGAQSWSEPVDHSPDSVSFQLSRNFYNSQATQTITVNEVGIYVRSSDSGRFCIVRDLITPIVVGINETIAIQYFIETYV